MKRTPSVLVVAIGLVHSVALASDDTNQTTEQIEPILSAKQKSIEVITTTASRIEASTGSIPLALSVVGADTLARKNAVHVEQALQLVAGANIHRGNGQEYLPSLRSPVLSGAGACGGLLTLEDGIPLRSSGFCNINELFESHTEQATRIEVLKGPGSPLYGSNAIHGVINVVTPDTTYSHFKAGLDLGSYGYKRTKFSTGTEFDYQGLGLAVTLTDDTGFRDDESVEQHKVSLRHRYDGQVYSVKSGLTYTNLDQQTASFIEGFEAYKDEEASQQNFDPDAFRQASALRAWSQINWTRGDTTFSITPYVRNQDMTFFKHFLPGTPLEENSQTGVGILSLMHAEVNDNWQLEFGVDADVTEGEFLQYQSNETEGSAFLKATVPTGKHYDYDVTQYSFASFLMSKWQYRGWRLELGGRLENVTYDYNNNMLVGRTKDNGEACSFGGCRYSRPESRKSDFSGFSPSFSLAYQIDQSHQVYTNVSKGYRVPQTAELYQLQRQQTVAELEEESVRSVEIGAKGYLSKGSYLLSFYKMNKANTIYRDSDFFTVSNGKTKHSGVELELDWQLTDSLTMRFAGAHSKHTYDADQYSGGQNINGNEIDTAPRNVATLGLDWQTTNSVSFGTSLRTVSRYFTDPENQHSYEGHNVVDAYAHWQFNSNLDVRLIIRNAFDARYAERADYTSFTGDRYFPGLPRRVTLTINYKAW